MIAIIKQSMTFTLLFALYERIRGKASKALSAGLLTRLMDWMGRLCAGSLIAAWFNSECKTERLWRESMLYRAADAVVNCIPRLLHWISGRWEKQLEGSRLLALLISLGSLAPWLVCLTLLALLAVPNDLWNNMYSLVLAFAALLLLWLSHMRREGRGLVELEPVGVWPILFLVCCLASAAWTISPEGSFRFIFFHITCALLVLVCSSAVRTERQFEGLLISCALGVCICSLYGFYQRFVVGIPASTSFTDLTLNANMPGRVYSFFDNPNACANVLVFFVPLMMSLTLYAPKRWMKLLFAAAAVVGAGAMLLTYSRGAWLACAAGVFVMVIIAKPRLLPLFAVLLFLLLPLLPATMLNRVFSVFVGKDSSINSRTYIYTAVYRIIRDNPLSGVGLGQIALKYVADHYGYYVAHFPFIHAHNIYLEIWAEAGILALLSFLATMLTALKKGYKTTRQAASALVKGAGVGVTGGIVGALVFGITDYAWSYPRVMALFWFLVAIGYTAWKLSSPQETSIKTL